MARESVRVVRENIDTFEVSLQPWPWRISWRLVGCVAAALIIYFPWSLQSNPTLWSIRCPVTSLPSEACQEVVEGTWPEAMRPIFTEALQVGTTAEELIDLGDTSREFWFQLTTSDEWRALGDWPDRGLSRELAVEEAGLRTRAYTNVFRDLRDSQITTWNLARTNFGERVLNGTLFALFLCAVLLVISRHRRQTVSVTANKIRVDDRTIEAVDFTGCRVEGRRLVFTTAHSSVLTTELRDPHQALRVLRPILDRVLRTQNEVISETAARDDAREHLAPLLGEQAESENPEGPPDTGLLGDTVEGLMEVMNPRRARSMETDER